MLNLNISKACFFGTRDRESTEYTSSTNFAGCISVAGCNIEVCEKLRTLGLALDQNLSFENHINSVVRSCYFHIWELRHIRLSLSRDVENTIGCCIINTRLDNCNSLLYEVTETRPNKLQNIKKKLARSVCDVSNRDHNTIDLLRNLHWLPVRSRIEFEVATLISSRCTFSNHVTYVTSFTRTLYLARCARQTSNRRCY